VRYPVYPVMIRPLPPAMPTMPSDSQRGRGWGLCLGVVTTVVAALAAQQLWTCGSGQLHVLAAAEKSYARAESMWRGAMEQADRQQLQAALRTYQQALSNASAPDQPRPRIQESAAAGCTVMAARIPVVAFVRWLARPLRLRCWHRIAAAQELLREEEPRGIIATSYEKLLGDGYCGEVVADAAAGSSASAVALHRVHVACLAPIARGTVMFAASPAEADAAFARAVQVPGQVSPRALSWTTRWQLPDRHTPGLKAQPWWSELAAVSKRSPRSTDNSAAPN
jgi:hypothetical protein